MPRNGTGTYTAPSNSWNPPVNGANATSTDWASTQADYVAALTQSVSSDGQTPMTGSLPMGNNKITGMANGVANTDGATVGQINSAAGQAGGSGDRNLLVNSNGANNQRVYVSGTATTVANQVTLDRWRVVTSGQNITFGAGTPDRTITAPAGGVEQVIEAGWIEGGVYTLSWSGTATAKVNGVAITNGGNTAVLTTNTAVTVQFASGTFTRAQFELGTAATPYYRRAPGLDLLLCQRDYAKSYALSVSPGAAAAAGRFLGGQNQGGFLTVQVTLPTSMRVVPTVQLWDQNSNLNSVLSLSNTGVSTTRAASVNNQTDHGFEAFTSTGGTDVVIAGQWAAATGF